MNVIPKTYSTYHLQRITPPPRPGPRTPSPGAVVIEERLAALPEYERATVEAMLTDLDDGIKGVGRQMALEIVWALCEWMRRGQ